MLNDDYNDPVEVIGEYRRIGINNNCVVYCRLKSQAKALKIIFNYAWCRVKTQSMIIFYYMTIVCRHNYEKFIELSYLTKWGKCVMTINIKRPDQLM